MRRCSQAQALARADAALAARKPPQPFDRDAARAELDALVARAGAVDRMSAEILPFEAAQPERAPDEPTLVVDVEGYRRPARSAARAGAAPEGRSREDLDPGAGRPVSRVHRGGAHAAARARRRLSGDGRLARLSEVAAAAAGAADARDGPSAEDMATALANRLRRLEAIREAAKLLMTRPQLGRDMFARGAAGADRRHQAPEVDGDALRSAHGLCLAAAAARARRRVHLRQADRLVAAAKRAPRWSGWSATAEDWSCMDDYPAELRGRAVAARDRVRLELCRRRWKWCAKARSRCTRSRRSRRSIVRKRHAVSRLPGSRRKMRAEVQGGVADARQVWREKRVEAVRAGERPLAMRAEELRLLEALLFASDEPLDEATLKKKLPDGIDIKVALEQLQARLCLARRQSGARRRQVVVPHGVRPVLADDAREHRDAAAVARGDRDAGDHRLPPAGDARRDRGDPRRRHLEGHARRAAGDRLDQAARPPQDAGPAADLRHHRSSSCRSSIWRRSATCRASTSCGAPACWTRACLAASACRPRRTIRSCARTRTRWSPAISTSRWRPRWSRRSRDSAAAAVRIEYTRQAYSRQAMSAPCPGLPSVTESAEHVLVFRPRMALHGSFDVASCRRRHRRSCPCAGGRKARQARGRHRPRRARGRRLRPQLRLHHRDRAAGGRVLAARDALARHLGRDRAAGRHRDRA